MPRIKTFDDPDLPPVLYGTHLVSNLRLFSEISYVEIDHCPTTKTLPDWEKEAMIILSNKYQAKRTEAVKPGCPAPYYSSIETINTGVDAQYEAMKAQHAAMKKAQAAN